MKHTPKKYRTIGIPRALYYYLYPALWRTFFEQLGLRVVLSKPSAQKTIELAGLTSEAEHCLALKVLDAHLALLAGRVDALFVPRILSTLAGHMACPKLGALPDTARAGAAAGTDVLTIDIDERKSPIAETLHALAQMLGSDSAAGAAAAQTAIDAMAAARREIAAAHAPAGPRLLLLGHPYILYDDFFSGRVIRKLESLQAGVELVAYGPAEVPETFIKWDTCAKMYKKLLTLTPDRYPGVIQLSSFNCGCDSIMMEFFRECLQNKGISYMVLVLDEHSSGGWIDTRLEAFVESLRWRNAPARNPNDG